MKKLILAAATLALTAGAANAGTRFINHRQGWQAARINLGIASGRLTAGETARLLAHQNDIRNLKLAAKSDGVVTPFERAVIHRQLNVQSGRIFRLKHN